MIQMIQHRFLICVLSALVVGHLNSGRAATRDTAASRTNSSPARVDFKAEFFRLCDLARKQVDIPRPVPHYRDSYAVRAIAVAFDLSGEKDDLDACKAWSDRMVGLQKGMNPAGAYYMNYGRKPGETKRDWYVADCASIGLGILATAVRCQDPAEKARYMQSVELYATLVLDNYSKPTGGVTDGIWSKSKDEWWCSTGIFGSLAFQLYRETGRERYLDAGIGAILWLNQMDMETTGPMTLREMGPTLPMYVLEAYSAAWPYLKPNTELYKRAVAQFRRCLDWMQRHQASRGATTIDYNDQWASKIGGLPFHMLVAARLVPGFSDLRPAAEEELAHICKTLRANPEPGLPQLVAFTLMSLAEEVSPATIYRSSKERPERK